MDATISQAPVSPSPPRVTNADADRRFRDLARRYGWDPDHHFVGGYVDWEWRHSRVVYDDLFTSVRGKKVLEFGCHFGGTACVLAALGAEVTTLDVDHQYVELTQLNAERHGLDHRIRALHVPDTTRLPFGDAEFDLISCNSVLEYVPPPILGVVQRELDRVLAPSGYIVILGTSNQLWPRELHSGRWLMNYVPRRFHPLFPGKPVESVWPWQMRTGFGDYTDLTQRDGGRLLVELKARMGLAPARLQVLAMLNRGLTRLGLHVGYVSPTITMLLQKRPKVPAHA